LAEGMRFELTVGVDPLQRFSKPKAGGSNPSPGTNIKGLEGAGSAANAKRTGTRRPIWHKIRHRLLTASVSLTGRVILTDRLRGLGATVMAVPTPDTLPELVARIVRLWAELHEADRQLALELARKLPDAEITRSY
jgi:hypothetical protein